MKSVVALSKIERRKQGKALREKCPRTSQAEWKFRPRSQDPINLLQQSDADRIPGLIPLRYERMSESPFNGDHPGAGPREFSCVRDHGAGLRRLPPDEFWWFCYP